MTSSFAYEPMLEMFLFETEQLLEHLEQIMLSNEKSDRGFEAETVNEIFRVMHTIKGSSAMMLFNNISTLSHAVEDVFYVIRENKNLKIDYSILTDIVLECLDFIGNEVVKLKAGVEGEGDPTVLVEKTRNYYSELKELCSNKAEDVKPCVEPEPENNAAKFYIGYSRQQEADSFFYKAIICFEDGCEMENIRAFGIVHNIREAVEDLFHLPENIIDGDASINEIREKGFILFVKALIEAGELKDLLDQTAYIKNIEFSAIEKDEYEAAKNSEKKEALSNEPVIPVKAIKEKAEQEEHHACRNVNGMTAIQTGKLDILMDLVGELVISEAMVTQNPELEGLNLENFSKCARHLKKITHELQDLAMSLRMIPVAATFQKMHRVVRDTGQKLEKDIELVISGEDTEIDKNIVESLSEPLMHLVRNSADHGIEAAQERLWAGKPEKGRIMLEARNVGGEVAIIVQDDGKGLDREKIIKKVVENGLIPYDSVDISDKEIYSFLFLPGFSTSEKVTEISGRGVGLDVVKKNIERIGGNVSVDSRTGKGTTFTIRIPLTLAIVSGMIVSIGNAKYTISIDAIMECFKPEEGQVFCDPDGNEMTMVRGTCYSVLRLHRIFNIKANVEKITDGIIIMVNAGNEKFCLFADSLLGEQQVVVKSLPPYIKKVNGIAGCTLLGDGSISLILDLEGIMAKSN